jgi:hypothetical protein
MNANVPRIFFLRTRVLVIIGWSVHLTTLLTPSFGKMRYQFFGESKQNNSNFITAANLSLVWKEGKLLWSSILFLCDTILGASI